MAVDILPKRKNICPTIGSQSPGVRYYLFILGMVTCLLFFMNTILAWDVYTSVPILKNHVNKTRILAGIYRHLYPEETETKIMDKVTNSNQKNTRKNRAQGVLTNNCSENFRRNHLMTIHQDGRTGNNLFQLATLIATAESTCYTAVRSPGINRNIDGIFNIQNIQKRDISKRSFKLLKEPGWSIYVDNIKSLILPEFNWTLGGYRQSYRYFQSHSELIKSSFEFQHNIKRDVIHYLENRTRVYQGFSVCMHVRRGDLVHTSKSGSSKLLYINRAISYFKKHLGSSNFSLVVASDDIRWCTSNIKGGNIYFSPFKDAGRDLFLLTQCNHNIMTVGSFGWFGAWLNETGIVVYDNTFARHEVGHKPGDYFPGHWIGL